MPITKRLKVHNGTKGLNQCLNYIMNDSKTDGGMLVSGHNCRADIASYEFEQNNRTYKKDKDDLSCYHIIQSFDFRDNISPEHVNEIGIKLCKELYPDYQCVVATHVDRGHLHNHIVVNATNLKGRKLDDRLANKTEGLYALREASDKLALEYGCSIIYDAPKIGRYKTKNHSYITATVNWKTAIREKIDTYKMECDSFEELLEKLSIDGYTIKNGKHVAIKPYGKERFTRMYTLGKGYTDDDLRDFYLAKEKEFVEGMDLSEEYPEATLSELSKLQKDIYVRSRTALIYSNNGIKDGKEYPKYRNTRYLEKQRYRNAAETLHFLNTEKIFHYEDLLNKAKANENEIKSLTVQYNKLKSEINSLTVQTTLANTYIENFNEYQNYLEFKKSIPNAEKSEQVILFEDVKKQLDNVSIDEVRQLLADSSKMKMDANKLLAKISYLKRKQTIFEMMREQSLEKDLIKHMSFSKKMIDEDRSNDNEYCVRLPYTKQYVYLPKECVVWSNYDVKATMYLRDDDDYYLYNEDNEVVGIVKGEELDDISLQEKERIKAWKGQQEK